MYTNKPKRYSARTQEIPKGFEKTRGHHRQQANRTMKKKHSLVLLGTTRYYLVLLGTTWYYLVLLGATWYYLVLLGTPADRCTKRKTDRHRRNICCPVYGDARSRGTIDAGSERSPGKLSHANLCDPRIVCV